MKRMKEIYNYRQMIFSLVRRELRGRYKGSLLGFFWTFLNPLLQLLVYSLVFSAIMRMGIENYYIFLFVALVPWLFFSAALTSGATCVLYNSDMIKKIYFPREVMPIANATSGFVNMLFSFSVVFFVLIMSGFGVSLKAILYLPIIMVVEYILALGVTMLVSALTVYFRDLAYILGIVAMAWQFLTPVMYSSEMIPEEYMFIFNINPMTPIIDAYRSVLYYKNPPELSTLKQGVFVGIVILFIGYFLFGKLQKGFAEEM